MSQTLYRTYRPKVFSDVLGQDHIVQTLQNALASDRISHAYLFTGPRGTGKTTVARLFATAVNTVPRKNFTTVSEQVAERLRNGTSLDVIEIDAASSTSVEGIRALKETIGTTPTEARYKVYIIDEVHMLSTSAFNALLKTLEEPPAHVVFILATTEIHKVPETILSRCQRFDFSRFSVADIMQKLRVIAKAEKVHITDDALEMVAITANGGMRDAESLLAQIFALEDKNVTAAEVATILGTSTAEVVLHMIHALIACDTAGALRIVDDIQKNGHNLETFMRSLIEKMRMMLFLSLQNTVNEEIRQLASLPKNDFHTLSQMTRSISPQVAITIIEECATAMQKIRNSTIPQLPIEIAIVQICMFGQQRQQTDATSHTNVSAPQDDSSQKKNTPKNTTASSIQKSSIDTSMELHSIPTVISADGADQWRDCVAHIEKIHRPIAQILIQCTFHTITEDTVTVTTDRSFYQERLLQSNHRTIIETALQDHFNKPMRIVVNIDQKNNNASSEILSYAQQLMGGAITN